MSSIKDLDYTKIKTMFLTFLSNKSKPFGYFVIKPFKALQLLYYMCYFTSLWSQALSLFALQWSISINILFLSSFGIAFFQRLSLTLSGELASLQLYSISSHIYAILDLSHMMPSILLKEKLLLLITLKVHFWYVNISAWTVYSKT